MSEHDFENKSKSLRRTCGAHAAHIRGADSESGLADRRWRRALRAEAWRAQLETAAGLAILQVFLGEACHCPFGDTGPDLRTSPQRDVGGAEAARLRNSLAASIARACYSAHLIAVCFADAFLSLAHASSSNRASNLDTAHRSRTNGIEPQLLHVIADILEIT